MWWALLNVFLFVVNNPYAVRQRVSEFWINITIPFIPRIHPPLTRDRKCILHLSWLDLSRMIFGILVFVMILIPNEILTFDRIKWKTQNVVEILDISWVSTSSFSSPYSRCLRRCRHNEENHSVRQNTRQEDSKAKFSGRTRRRG